MYKMYMCIYKRTTMMMMREVIDTCITLTVHTCITPNSSYTMKILVTDTIIQ